MTVFSISYYQLALLVLLTFVKQHSPFACFREYTALPFLIDFQVQVDRQKLKRVKEKCLCYMSSSPEDNTLMVVSYIVATAPLGQAAMPTEPLDPLSPKDKADEASCSRTQHL